MIWHRADPEMRATYVAILAALAASIGACWLILGPAVIEEARGGKFSYPNSHPAFRTSNSDRIADGEAVGRWFSTGVAPASDRLDALDANGNRARRLQ